MNHPDHSPLDALFRPPALIAVLLAGEALALVIALSAPSSAGWTLQFGLASLGIQWISLSTLCAIYLLRHPLAKLTPSTVAWVCLAALLCMTLLITSAGWGILSVPTASAGGKASFILRMLAIALIVGLLTLLTYQNYWRAQHLAVRAKQAELDALQARIQPHFLFNTLNTGVALVHQQPEKVEQLLLDLADLFRAALTGSEQISLQEELELTRRYIEIEQLRFGSRLQLSWLPPSLPPDLWVPALSIQPLVENAIHHGVEPSARPCTLRVAVEYDARRILVIVENDLPDPPASTHRGHQVGLQAARTRVQAMGGDIVTETEDGQFRATLSLPRT